MAHDFDRHDPDVNAYGSTYGNGRGLYTTDARACYCDRKQCIIVTATAVI